MTAFAILAAFASIWGIIKISDLKRSRWTWVIIILWSICPGIWFGIENWQIAKHLANVPPDPILTPLWIAQHGYYQEAAKLLWAGIAALILLILQFRLSETTHARYPQE